MTEEVKGALDNYFNADLSAEEKAYFDSRGSEHSEEKVAETIDVKTEREQEPEEVSQETGEDVLESGERQSSEGLQDEEDESSDADELDDEPKLKADRDYEKAFKTERHKRKELREALEAQAKKTAEIEVTLNQLRQNAMQKQAAPEPLPAKQEPVPDADDDPLGYLQYQIKQQEKAIVEHNKYLTKRHEIEQRSMQEQAFKQVYANSAKEFAQKQTDFSDAYNFLTDSKVKEYIASGFTPQQANEFLIEDEMALVSKAFEDKINPAERIYNLAKARGYSVDDTSKKQAPAKSLSDIKKGLANSKSLKSGGGQPTEREAGIDDIDGMNFEEFDTYWNKLKASSKGMR